MCIRDSLVSINGGIEQPGGLDLKLEDDDTYRTMTFDDYLLYYCLLYTST